MYKMPDVGLGQIVFWYPQGEISQEPHVAIVTRVAPNSLCLNILEPTNYNFRIADGVRHASDPRVKEKTPDIVGHGGNPGSGAWAHTPWHLELLTRLENIEGELALCARAPDPAPRLAKKIG